MLYKVVFMLLIDLVQEGNKWRAVVNTGMNLRVPYSAGLLRLAEELLTSQKGLPSMEFVT